jgi:hypothetical protein
MRDTCLIYPIYPFLTEAVKKVRQSPLFFDLTISLSKSISIFHASLGENARLARQVGDKDGDAYWSALVAEVDDMIWQAVHTGFGYFQRETGYTPTPRTLGVSVLLGCCCSHVPCVP